MPSPFPGMDPWLEAADIWPDFHDRFASEMSAVLNATLPPPYYARLQMRPEIGVVDGDIGTAYRHRVVPDVAVAEVPRRRAGRAGTTATLPRTELSDYLEITVPDEPGRHASIEVRDPRRHHRVITFIEIVSPANKTPGPDRESFLDKQQEVLASEASLMEIDLLRGGRRLLPSLRVERQLSKRKSPADYLVLVSPAWKRGEGAGTWRVFPIALRQMLPVVAVPLRAAQPEVPIDLQHVFNRSYDAGPYRRGAIDYGAPPHPLLTEADYTWAREQLERANERKTRH